MKELLDRYSQRPPEIVFEWSDSETEARGWVRDQQLARAARLEGAHGCAKA